MEKQNVKIALRRNTEKMKKTASVVLLMLLFTGVPAIAFGVQYTGERERARAD